MRNSSAFRRIEAAPRFSSKWAIDEVPGISSMAGERCRPIAVMRQSPTGLPN